jgi:hypothetical protein
MNHRSDGARQSEANWQPFASSDAILTGFQPAFLF